MPRVPLRLWALWFVAVWLFHAGGLRAGGSHGPLSPALTAWVLALIAALKWTLASFFAVRLTGRLPLGVPFRWRVARLHALAALGYGLFALWTRLLADFALGTRSPVHQPAIAVGAVLMNAVIFALFAGAAHTVLYAHALGSRTIAELRLRRILAQAELDRTQAEMRALKMELNPHFLFNALNSISSLLYTDVAAAEHMVERLAELLRRALAQVDTQCVPLRDELELLRLYLEIEQTRFGERLSVEWAVDPEVLDAEVPHLVLQPLVENAIKHAIAPLATAGRMRIAARADDGRLRLEVHDNGPGLADAAPSSGGIGLANTRARLARLYEGEHRFELHPAETGGVVAEVEIPLRVLNGLVAGYQ
jgi:signal transduction histidine kinase